MLKVIASVIFTAFIFTFLHSEFGLFDFDENNHSTHDYCEIVKTAATKITKDVSKKIYKLKVDKSISLQFIDDTIQNIKANTSLDLEQFCAAKKTTEVYLFNRVFLI